MMKKAFLFLSLFVVAIVHAQTRVACVGSSVTEGYGSSDMSKYSYPAQLGRLLGKGYRVMNFGAAGHTMLRNGDYPYWETGQYEKALASKPDIVFIDLGRNDAKAQNRVHMSEMESDCIDMIESFKQLPSHPRMVLMLPIASFEPDTSQIWDAVIVTQIIPTLRRAAYREGVEVLDMHSLFVDKKGLMPDNIHPDDEGYSITARRLYEQVNLKTEKGLDIFKAITIPYSLSYLDGYACANFQVHGRQCMVVKPRVTAVGRPWVWRSRFWWHEPQTDIALLERGFHVVYCDVAEMMGNDEALSIWSDFYNMLTLAGLSTKSTMEGMSRGGMYALCWAAANPDKIANVYIDNPLLDCGYFADEADKPRKSDDVVGLMDAYNLRTAEDVRNFKGNPMDKVEDIVKGKYPVLIIYADSDEAVPPTQTPLFEKKVRALGGDITVMVKHGFHHHPHSFPNPTPIVNFILKSTDITNLNK